ncbi:MAG: methyltransferase domain-containing protein [Desulfobacterales bacterium]|jgi:arsenite methyltransferase|nr:methyltransferase domain-containing protein [Desulfobacteraceae bacterium]MBT4362912.1 methyltransferase domain-containing protein [Desulfobacteraceae bacterium]MBT7085781.1 methyltransferase domain-containing protein [Desulfobacterales bacterium]
MTEVKFEGETGRLHRALAQCHDMVVRRSAVFESLNLSTGEKVLDVGCGGGFYTYEAAQFVGSTGQVCAIDISEDQIGAARQKCTDFPWVECRAADVLDLPYEDSAFDAIYGVQVLEFVANADDGLKELLRVLKPGGRLVILSTNWNSLVWFSTQPERMKKMLTAFDQHAPYPDFPAELPSKLRKIGMKAVIQKPLSILNMSYNENSYSYWIAKGIKQFVLGRELVDVAEVEDWFEEFEKLEREGAFFFCSTSVITEVLKTS